MNGERKPRILSERRGKWLLNLYPPLLFHRIRIVKIDPGFRKIRVRVARSFLTRNLNGTIFGGSIFSAADPFYSVMYWQIFARRRKRIQVWLRSASVHYRKPAATALTLEFSLTEEQIREADAALQEEGKYVRVFSTDALDLSGEVCATIETEVYLCLPGPAGQGEVP
jgi:acyl-coenzyme A thioesterase PaaI-like protein